MKKQTILITVFLLSAMLFSCKKDSTDVKGTTWKINYESPLVSGTYSIKFNTDGTFNYTEGSTVVNNITSGYTQTGDSVVWSFKSANNPWFDYHGKLNGKTIAGKIIRNSAEDEGSFTGTKN